MADGNPLTLPGITWNNKPSLLGQLKMSTLPDPPDPSLTNGNSQYYPIDLLAGLDDSWLAGDLIDGYLSMALVIPAVPESTSFYFCSKESNPLALWSPLHVSRLYCYSPSTSTSTSWHPRTHYHIATCSWSDWVGRYPEEDA